MISGTKGKLIIVVFPIFWIHHVDGETRVFAILPNIYEEAFFCKIDYGKLFVKELHHKCFTGS